MTEAERELLSLVIGHRIRSLRKTRRLSQNDLASGVGSQSMISLIESGRQLPPSDVLRFLANRLEDSVLEGYAANLENNNLDDFSVSSQNEDDLMGILRSHRGRWYAAHERIASQLCHHYYYTRNFRQVVELCRLIIYHIQHGRSLGEAYFYLGSAKLNQNSFAEAEKWLRKSEEYYDHLSDILRGKLYYNLGYAYTYLDIQVLALWYASKSVEIFHMLNEFPFQGTALALLGTIQTRLGRLEEAKASLLTAFDIVKRWTFNWTDRTRMLVTLAEVHTLLGETNEAMSILQEAVDHFNHADNLCQAEIHRFQAHLALSDNDIQSALQFASKGITAAQLAGDPHSLSQLYFLQLQIVTGTREKIELARKAYDLTVNTNHHILHALAAETMASLLEELEDPQEDSKQYMQTALDSYRTYVHKNSMFTHLIDHLPIRQVRKEAPMADEEGEVEDADGMGDENDSVTD